MKVDVAVIGGSFAGMAAALQVARANRSVLVVDAGLFRNRQASASHGFLGRDKVAPRQLLREARRQLMTFPKLRWIEDTVDEVARDGHGMAGTNEPPGPAEEDHALEHLRFSFIADGERWSCRRLILATGVVDELPPIPGLAPRWGRSVFHCPYCHGYELLGGDIGVVVRDAVELSLAKLLTDWGRVHVLSAGQLNVEGEHRAELEGLGVVFDGRAIRRISDACTVQFENGEALPMDGLFVVPRTRIANTLPAQLGVTLADGPHGRYIETDARRATSVPGVYACGDLAHAAGNISQAVADGATAGIFAHESMVACR